MVNLVNSEKYIIKSEIFKVSYYASELFIDIVYWISFALTHKTVTKHISFLKKLTSPNSRMYSPVHYSPPTH